MGLQADVFRRRTSGFQLLYRALFFLVGFGFAALGNAAELAGIATVVDGEAVLVRLTSKQTLSPGARLIALDLIATGPAAAIVRVEFNNGAVADLGPGTRVMVAPPLIGLATQQPLLYVLQGWVKVTGAPGPGRSDSPLVSDAIGLSNLSGRAVVALLGGTSSVFAESGTVNVSERRQGYWQSEVALKSGAFYVKTGSGKPAVTPNPSATFSQSVPKAFLDPIPLRAGVYTGKPEPKVKILGELSYAEAVPWLNAEAAIKTLLVTQWRAHLNPDLRAGLVSRIKSHPEWERTLFPERFLPKPGPSAPVVSP